MESIPTNESLTPYEMPNAVFCPTLMEVGERKTLISLSRSSGLSLEGSLDDLAYRKVLLTINEPPSSID